MFFSFDIGSFMLAKVSTPEPEPESESEPTTTV